MVIFKLVDHSLLIDELIKLISVKMLRQSDSCWGDMPRYARRCLLLH